MADRPRIEIQPEHWKIVNDILRRHVPHFDVWAFGSRARFTAKKQAADEAQWGLRTKPGGD